MKVQRILGSPAFIMLGVAIARTMPARFAYWLARKVARGMARRRAPLFLTVRANLSRVVGPEVDEGGLRAMVENAIYHAGCTYYDMFRRSQRDYQQGRVTVRVDPDEWASVEAALRDGRGTLLVGPHMSNFDLAAQWIAAQGIEMYGLSLAGPDLGTRVVNALRRRRGFMVTPIDFQSLRMAVTHLREGGIVITGVDRPVSEIQEPILFFDAPARLPMGHIRLALHTDSRVVVACCVQDPDGCYAVRLAPPIEMETTGYRAHDIRHNARRVLDVIEGMIREVPEQWLMFMPVWSEENALEPRQHVSGLLQVP